MTEVLRQLDLTPCAEEVREQLEKETAQGKLAAAQHHHEITELEKKRENLKEYLGCGDKQREEIYWQQYQATEKKLKQLLDNPVSEKVIAAVDIKMVKQFLMNLPDKWQHYSPAVRNRLLGLIIEKVHLQHDTKTIDATVYWKTGFYQRVVIQRAGAPFDKSNGWTNEENKLPEKRWPNAPLTAVGEVFPGRTLSAIRNHTRRLGLKRRRKTSSPGIRRPWTSREDTQAREFYRKGASVSEIAIKLNRTQDAVIQRAASKK